MSQSKQFLQVKINELNSACMRWWRALRRTMESFGWLSSVYSGADSGGGRTQRVPPLPKIGKNMIFWRKIVIFHTKYSKIFRASLGSAQFFLSAPPLTWNPGSAPAIVLRDLNPGPQVVLFCRLIPSVFHKIYTQKLL